MPSMGGSATLISAPHLGDLLDVDMSAKVDQSIPSWQAGAGKYEPLPGVVGDGQRGLRIPGQLYAGDQVALATLYHLLQGVTNIAGGVVELASDGGICSVDVDAILPGSTDALALDLRRNLDRAGHAATGGVLRLKNTDASGGDSPIPAGELVLSYQTDGNVQPFRFNHAGGIGLFGAIPPIAQPAITGALSTVADAPAKAVLTSIIAALVGCGLASNGTT